MPQKICAVLINGILLDSEDWSYEADKAVVIHIHAAAYRKLPLRDGDELRIAYRYMDTEET
jgi:hypothetical protein